MAIPALGSRDFSRTTLKPRHRKMVAAIAEALFSPDEKPLEPVMLDAFVTNVDGFMSPASKTLRSGLMLMLELLRFLPLVVIGKFSLFDDLPIALRTRMLEEDGSFPLFFFSAHRGRVQNDAHGGVLRRRRAPSRDRLPRRRAQALAHGAHVKK